VNLGKVWEIINGQKVWVDAVWRVYGPDAEGMRGFEQFLHDNSRYAGALSIWNSTRDPVKFIKAVNEAGYATDPTWWQKVASIAGYQQGGWAGLHGPELAWLGERGPEYVVPNAALRGGGTAGPMQTVTMPIVIGDRTIEEIWVTGRDLAIRRGRVPGAGSASMGSLA